MFLVIHLKDCSVWLIKPIDGQVIKLVEIVINLKRQNIFMLTG